MTPRPPAHGQAPPCPGRVLTRRDFLRWSAAATLLGPAAPLVRTAEAPPAAGTTLPPRKPTALGLCPRYEFAPVRQTLASMFDQLGDVASLVRGKHVTVKVNLVNSSAEDVAGIPLSMTVTVHPVVALALGSLLVSYGARQVRFVDQLPFTLPDEEAFAGYGFRLGDFGPALDRRVRFENTRNRGAYRDYAWVKVPGGGELASAWEVNRTYADTDVLVSLTKLKSHVSAGVSLGMKNLFGIPPSSLYGDDLGDEPNESASGYRNRAMHNCTRKPLTSAASFTGRSIEGDHGHNVPRFVVDLASAFPVQLVVIDGISVIQSAEGWWLGSMVSVTRPGLLIAGRNPVCTDAVATAVMGFDPDAPDRSWPFANGANHLALARQKGLGENRLPHLEVVGTPLETARFEFQPTYRRRAPNSG